MDRWNCSKWWLNAVVVDGLFFPQRVALGLDARESTPGFKRQIVVTNAEVRSTKRASIVMEQTVGFKVSSNTIQRICEEVGQELVAAEAENWKTVLTGESLVPELAIVSYDGGRMRTRQMDCGPGVHPTGKGWNETKNAIFVSASSSSSSETDPQPDPPACFLKPKHVAKLTETAKVRENAAESDDFPEKRPKSTKAPKKRRPKKQHPPHKPKRILRSVLSSLANSRDFGAQMEQEARRRRFFEAMRRAFVGDGLACNWTIHETFFTPILDFTHAVTYLFRAAHLCTDENEQAWPLYERWLTTTWRGQVDDVISELQTHQQRIGLPPEGAAQDDPREQLRLVIGYLQNNRDRMRYDEYRRAGLPTTSAWMESTVKEMNYRVKGTEMFWNNPTGAEAILAIRAAALSDDNRLARFLARRPGVATVRRPEPSLELAA